MEQIVPSGLYFSSDKISEQEEKDIITWLDSIGEEKWSNKLARRTQHYGTEYNYKSKKLDSASYSVLPISGPLLDIMKKFPSRNFTQCIVNEYKRDQGIAAHSDSLEFGDTIIGVSLCDDTVMKFTRDVDGEMEEYDLFLPKRSIMMMKGEARYQWKHSIDKKVSYVNETGDKIVKPSNYRRISLTYRTIAQK